MHEKSFKELLEIYRKRKKSFDHSYSDEKYNKLSEIGYSICSKFFSTLDHLVYANFSSTFSIMGLDTCWDWEIDNEDYSSTKRIGTFSLVYLPNDSGELDPEYSPLVVFEFNLDFDKMNESYVEEIFRRMEKKLAESLEIAYEKWTHMMIGYYEYLRDHFKDIARGEWPVYPMDDPENGIFVNEIIKLG